MPAGSWPYWSDAGRYQNTCLYWDPQRGYSAVTTDVGYGEQAPPLNGDGTVFIPVNSLPMFLWTVNIFLAVAASLDPDFRANYGDSVIRYFAGVLEKKYELIMQNGLKQLSPPNWASAGLLATVCGAAPEAPSPPGIRVIYLFSPPPPYAPVEALIEYGAVERFSGTSSVGDSYTIPLNGSDLFDPAPWYKLQIRVLRRTKDVYRQAGLQDAWQVINNMKAVVGDPPLPGPNLADWSIRTVAHVSYFDPDNRGFSLRSLGLFIIGTQPFDTPYSPGATSFSLRTVLTNFSD
jgi:hypothetical protein